MVTHITLPLDQEVVAQLRVYEQVLLSGTMLVGRDQVHARLCALIEHGEPLPVSLRGETIYYMGPAGTPPHTIIGSCGPTTSARMDRFSPLLLSHGLIGMVGKGPRSEEVIQSIIAHCGIYFVAFGGCGALYATKVVSYEPIAFEDIGPEALLKITVSHFPAIVGIDCQGNSLFS